MEILDKLKILADSAKYDVSRSSSGSNRKNKKGQLGNAAISEYGYSWPMMGDVFPFLKCYSPIVVYMIANIV